ncbi:hypothetical protein CALVIDRAFT_543268 [Calocera viscosa TUFC12733]|uniref:Alpha/beta hydrolase fold-3 domain-containing protein n=1 Tax=Calocera viscosa (strain TUFC12733) TaxID=1330018 RepID=A0A167FRY4_CALVF|nr:hypothetical protein CALVIDRAFT_543268 [Calocera viscosa TUFC12733]
MASVETQTRDEEYERLFRANPTLHALLKGDVVELRERTAALKSAQAASVGANPQSANAANTDPVEIRDDTATANGAAPVPVRLYSPKDVNDELFPVFVIFHGGGWVVGDFLSEDRLARKAVIDCRFLVVNADYRLAPEHLFPAAHDDGVTVLRWIVSNADTLKIDRTKIVVYGNSAGANIAAAALQTYSADAPPVPIAGQILRIPALSHPSTFPTRWPNESMTLYADAPILGADDMRRFYDIYGGERQLDKRLSPLVTFAEHPVELPPAVIQVAGMDPLRDDGLAYAAALREAGVKVKCTVYPGVPHGFTTFVTLAAAKRAEEELLTELKALVA